MCDRCWHAAGGEDAVVTTIDEHGHLTVTLEGSPEFEQLVAEVELYDRRHPVDRCLIENGVRWETLRHIAVPARCDLVRCVLEREAPAHTRLASGPDAWFEAVEARVDEQTGIEFKYRPKVRRWLAVANVFRWCADWTGRPLTWVSQEEIAAAVGCSTRTVGRVVRWLRCQGLLHEVLPGFERLPRQAVPDDETAAEQAEREARAAAAVAAEEAAIARARGQLDAVRGGLFGEAAVAAAEEALSPAHAAALAAAEELEPAWVQLVPVYELRVPMSEAERAEEAAIARAHTQLRSPGEQLLEHHSDHRVHVRNLHLYARVTAVYAGGGHTVLDPYALAPWAATSPLCPDCGPVVGYLRQDPLGADLHQHQFGYPPQVISSNQLESRTVQPVDNRPASPGSDPEQRRPGEQRSDFAENGRTGPSEGDRPKTRQSEAVRAAEWLLRSRLHPMVCDGVSVRWLAGIIRGSRLLAEWHWTWNDLADLIHGVPEHPHLPRYIHNPRGWIKARFKRSTGVLPPSKLKIIRQLDSGERARQADGAAKRAAIDHCPLCDEHGWLDTGPTAPDVRCNHDPETGGW